MTCCLMLIKRTCFFFTEKKPKKMSFKAQSTKVHASQQFYGTLTRNIFLLMLPRIHLSHLHFSDRSEKKCLRAQMLFP